MPKKISKPFLRDEHKKLLAACAVVAIAVTVFVGMVIVFANALTFTVQ